MYTRVAMPDLQHRLRTHDLGFLKIVAEFWGVALNAPDAKSALPRLSRDIIDPALVLEVVDALPENARQALDALVVQEGWMAWHRFTRQFGPLREVGPGKRDREKPYLDPVSATEMLWYRGLIGRDFLQRDGELQECAYIPDDILELLPPVLPVGPPLPGRAASPGETAFVVNASDRILNHTCTLLAALRLEDPQRSPAAASWQPPQEVVHTLLGAMKLITSSEQPVAEDARPFLEMPRGEALAWLVKGWRGSSLFNELRLMTSIICEGSWQNEPVDTRERVLALLSEVPEHQWWNIDSFIQAIHEREPEFQRPAGDFDTWLIRDALSGESLTGIRHWDAVDGALLRYLITAVMHWLGLIDLALPGEGQPATAFRFSEAAPQLLMGKPAENLMLEDQLIETLGDGTLIAGTHTPRIARYQVARFCLWVDETQESYTYRVTPASLSAAASQGLKIIHLEKLLNKYGATPPPSLIQALHRWEQKGGESRIQPGILLRVEDPKIMSALRESPAGRFVRDPLSPTSALIDPQAVEKVSAALARLGFLCDLVFPDEEQEQLD